MSVCCLSCAQFCLHNVVVAQLTFNTDTMTTLQGAPANLHCRKRSFEVALESEPCLSNRPYRHVRHGPSPRSMTFPVTLSELSNTKQRLKTPAHTPSMTSHPPSVMSITYPSFMSVYGSDEGSLDPEHVGISQVSQKEQEIALGQSNQNTVSQINHMLPTAIHHRGSIASINTTSTASSATTTHSSPVFTDPSPSSSPESASSNPPSSTFHSTMQPFNHDRTWSGNRAFPQHQRTNSNLNPRSESPNGNATNRNPKNLTINMSTVMQPRPATSHGVNERQPFSEPTSPFKEIPRSARKKPANLSIRTPGFNQLNFSRATIDIPPTPTSRPSFQNIQSSPSLHSLATPTTSSFGGLHLSLPSFINGHSRPGSDSSFSSQSASGLLPGLKEEEEARKSQETQEQGYPDGPILIYDCGLYLSLEPTAEEACRFDTVINVAKEVKSPFGKTGAPSNTVMSVLRTEMDGSYAPEPQTAISEMSFKSAWEYQPTEAPTPRTPRPESWLSRSEPEYVHVQWDHNSEILQDLFPLCELIDERVAQGKKVLVHCQLGVSRSASLVIAFGLYKGYQPDFHSMYMQVKGRSRWVGPNMSLIYQLTDFRKKVLSGEYQQIGKPPPGKWFRNVTVTSPALRAPFQSLNLQEDSHELVKTYSGDLVSTPQTAKPVQSLRLDKELPPVPSFPKEEKPKSVSHIINQYARPLTEPEVTSPNELQRSAANDESSLLKTSIEPRPLPFRKLSEYSRPQSIPPHRPREGERLILQFTRPPSLMDLASQDVPQTPSLFSPRATEFMASPFGISSTVGDLAVDGPRSARSVGSISPPLHQSDFINSQADPDPVPLIVDPRSPHQHGDTGEILRHIDNVL